MQTTYNAFSGSAPASNDNAFQSAIDYLIANRQKPVFNNQGGLFAQGTEANTPTSNLSSVVQNLFGDDYIRNKNQGGDSGGGVGVFTGNPYAGGGSGVTGSGLGFRGMSPGDWSNLATTFRGEGSTIGGVAGLLTGNPLLGVAAKYGVPAFADYMAKQSYDPFMASGVYDYLSQDNVNRDLVDAGYTPAGYNEQPLDINWADYGVNVPSDSGGGGGWTDAGGGSFDYSADTGYDGNW